MTRGVQLDEPSRPYTPASALRPDAGSRARFERCGRDFWAVPESREGDALLALVTYNQGVQALIECLEAYERCIEAIRGHIIPHNN